MKSQDLAARGGVEPLWTRTITGLFHDPHATNCSLLPFEGRRLFAYRAGWFGSRIHVAELDENFKVLSSAELRLPHPLAVGGQEDPRLFVHRNKLHVAFVGVRKLASDRTVGRQLIARLSGDLRAEEVWEPQYLWTTQWEKNWQPFGFGEDLYAVYSMDPWRVVHLLDGKARPVLEQRPGVRWGFGVTRGGAAPVRKGREYYCFFHGTDKRFQGDGDPCVYTAGVCTFEAKFPFRPLRQTAEPVLWPDMGSVVPGWGVATVFPCGAYFDKDKWVVSYGSNDFDSRVSAFDAAEIEDRLTPVPQ